MNQCLNKLKGVKGLLVAEITVRDYEGVFEECLKTKIVVEWTNTYQILKFDMYLPMKQF